MSLLRNGDETHALYSRLVYPIRLSSTALAASLPSRIAHTTSDCPRCISPAVNTPGSEVSYESGAVFTFVLGVSSTPNASDT